MGFFMAIRGPDAPSAGNAGIIGGLAEVFNPAARHSAQAAQYDRHVGRRTLAAGGQPLNFADNTITLSVTSQKPTEQS